MAMETVITETEEKVELPPEETGKPEETKQTETDEDRIEALAREMGWTPKEDFKGDDADFVDAETYIRRGRDIQESMRKSLKEQKQQLAAMSNSLAELKSHNEKVYKAEIARLKKELTSLKTQKKEAIEEGDVDRVNDIDEQIDVIKESISSEKEEPATTNQPPENPEFNEWLKNNQWYLEDDEMARYADSIAATHRGISFKRIAKLVDKSIREVFPDKFPDKQKTKTNTNTTTTTRVEGSTRQRPSGRFTEADLTPEQKSIMNQFVRQGIMTKEEYIKDIALISGGAK